MLFCMRATIHNLGIRSKQHPVVLVVTPPVRLQTQHIAEAADILHSAISTAGTVFRFVRIPQPSMVSRSFPPLKTIHQAVEAADVVWLHDALSLNSYTAFRAARKRNKPILVTQHSGPASTSFVASRLDRAVTQKILGEATQIIFTNDNVATYYCDRVAFSAPAQIISNGIDLHTFQMTLPEKRKLLRARFALREGQPVLLFNGSFIAKTGLPIVRHLAQLMPYWRFWLTGDGPLRPEKWFLPNVQTFRNRASHQMAELYQAADLLIAPGWGAQPPTSLQEALACGLPALCSPELASSNAVIKPVLLTADTMPEAPLRTAQLWAARLNLMRSRNDFPLAALKRERAGLADGLWGWQQVADCYVELLSQLTFKTFS
jgi:glycosyltransferase involved in cell wall biosynthesis